MALRKFRNNLRNHTVPSNSVARKLIEIQTKLLSLQEIHQQMQSAIEMIQKNSQKLVSSGYISEPPKLLPTLVAIVRFNGHTPPKLSESKVLIALLKTVWKRRESLLKAKVQLLTELPKKEWFDDIGHYLKKCLETNGFSSDELERMWELETAKDTIAAKSQVGGIHDLISFIIDYVFIRVELNGDGKESAALKFRAINITTKEDVRYDETRRTLEGLQHTFEQIQAGLLKEFSRGLGLPLIPRVQFAQPQRIISSNIFDVSDDYTEVTMDGQTFELSGEPVEIIRMLHEDWKDQGRGLKAKEIMKRLGTPNSRIEDKFRSIENKNNKFKKEILIHYYQPLKLWRLKIPY